MKNKLVYILTFIFIFILNINVLNASEDYQFYCDYEVTTFRETAGKGAQDAVKFPLRVYVNKDNSVKYFSNDKEIRNKMYMSEFDSTYGSNMLEINGDFYKLATSNGNTCPQTIFNFSSDGLSAFLTFSNDWSMSDDSYIVATTITKEPVINSSLDVEEKDKLEENIKKITKNCSKITYIGNIKYLDSFAFEMNLNTYNTGEKEMELTFVDAYGNKETLKTNYSNEYGAVFRFKEVTITIPEGEESLWFGNVCPTADNIYPREHIDSYYDNVQMLVTRNKDIAYINGKDPESSGTMSSESLSDLQDNFKLTLTISDKSGVCVDYLGEASKEGTVANLLDEVYGIIKIGSIILVIVLSMLEFAKVTTKSKDELMEAVKKLAIRLVILIILLLLPTFVDMIGNLFGIEDILCGIK